MLLQLLLLILLLLLEVPRLLPRQLWQVAAQPVIAAATDLCLSGGDEPPSQLFSHLRIRNAWTASGASYASEEIDEPWRGEETAPESTDYTD